MISACSANKNKTPMAVTIGASNTNVLTNNEKVITMDTLAVTNQNVTMSSREIAELSDKEHKHVVRDIEKMLSDLGIYSPNMDFNDFKGFSVNRTTYRGRNVIESIDLDQDLTMTLMMGYKVQLRHKVAKRWRELESGKANPMTALNDPSFLRSTLLTYTEKVIELESQVEEMKPDVAALTRIAKSEGSMCVTDAAKQLQVKPKSLFNIMSQCKWIYRRLGTPWIGYQDKIQQGLIEHKVTVITKPDGEDKSIPQVRVTPKGLSTLAKLLTQGAAA